MGDSFQDYRLRGERDPPRDAEDPREEETPLLRELPPREDEMLEEDRGALERDGALMDRDDPLEGADIERLLDGAGLDRTDERLGLDTERGERALVAGAWVRARDEGATRVGLCRDSDRDGAAREGLGWDRERDGAVRERGVNAGADCLVAGGGDAMVRGALLRVGASWFTEERFVRGEYRLVEVVTGEDGAVARTRLDVFSGRVYVERVERRLFVLVTSFAALGA